MAHEQNGEHFYNDESSLSTMDRARHVYIDHLKGARLLEEISNKTAIQSLQSVNNKNSQVKYSNDLYEHIFLSQGYAIRHRQKSTKMTPEQQDFFAQLFYQGEVVGKKVSVEKAHQEMRLALKPDKSKLFLTNQYLTKNQIRSLFGRLSKKQTNERRQHWINKDKNHDQSEDSDEDAEDYFKIQQEQEWTDLKADEVVNARDYYSGNESDSDTIE
ncbi:unnamed protein product [Adineta steineri]|uniref:Uncharacterized protein n=1 Tax=Adineta steineri TaxID=433720 RepID=A0A815SVF0_9BILA|nr:unnamed protein product [Adineta steineri]CAF4100528.1 unnamed protein product [Adineta steineri]